MAARFLTAFAAALLLVSPVVQAQQAQQQSTDPPGRVGRLSAIEGNVQQRTPDDNDWTQANLNYPVSTGFAIAPQDGARAEIEVGSTALRVGPASELDVSNLSDRDASFTLAQGELNVRVGRLARSARVEIVTPRGVMEILATGQYHIDAGTTESPTRFEVFDGRAELQREGGNTALASGQAALINPDDAQSLTMASAEPDELDQWAFAREGGATPRARTARASPGQGGAPGYGGAQGYGGSPGYGSTPGYGGAQGYGGAPGYAEATPGYVSPEMTGADDLQAYGSWNTDPQYGSVWYPSGVAADWAPYTYGHWGWVSPWGWTWIDDEPWGFAPFHYGRWAHTGVGWGWIPGTYVETPIYAPALVVFFGGGSPFYYDGYNTGIGWCALGPGELFVPSFSVSVSVNFVRNVNITNVNINQFNITRVNNTIVVNNDPHWGGQASNFANHRFATVVPANQFGRPQRVHDIAVHNASVTTAVARLPVSRDPAVTPPRTAAGAAATNRAAQFNRGGQPPLPQTRTATGIQPRQPGGAPGANTQSHTVAGHTLPALPPAHGGAATNAPGRFGTGAGSVTTNNAGRGQPPMPPTHGGAPSINRAANGAPQSGGAAPGASAPNRTIAGHTLPSLPPAHGGAATGRARNGAPQGAAVNNPATTGRTARGPLGTTTSTAPNVTSNSAGRGLSQLPTNRQQTIKPPAPQAHVAQPPMTTTGSTAGHRGFAAPAAPSVQRNTAAPTHTVTPPTRPQAPVHTVARTRTFTPPPHPEASTHTAAPTRSFTPPPRTEAPAQTAAPARSFTPPARTEAPAHAAAPARSFTPPPTPHVAAPVHNAPPAAPARPVGNAAVSHTPAPAAHPQPAPHPATNNNKPVTNNNKKDTGN